ncbi:MAG: 4'-phosphopantetheinyl transferase superfamily protein [Colwellia sp.]|nr:4'-phosphopantetheinyl transferase superfamily protein [Colwellia sp.]
MHNLAYTKPSLKADEYHIWYTKPQLGRNLDLYQRYKQLLTAQEIEKQQRYIFEKDRHDALVTRAFIRNVLSQYIPKAPEDWRFTKGEYGKPEIIDPSLPLRFNISHTKDLIVCAITLVNDIGCDVEYIERKSDILAIANRYFSKLETRELFRLPEAEQRSRFFDYWTLKESYIKAWGQGLAIPLSDFSFHIGESNSAKKNTNINLSFSSQREDDPKRWKSWIFYPNQQHRISVSIRSVATQIKHDDYKVRFFETTPLVKYQEHSEIILE